MEPISWISDENFNIAFDSLIKRANNAKIESAKRMQKNVTDPFASLVIASIFDIKTADALKTTQEGFSSMSGLHSAIGKFHQDVLGSVEGWVNHDAGYDLENADERIVAEIKNKHNTLNAAAREAAISNLNVGIKQKGRGWTAYLVIIVPKKPIPYKARLNFPNVFEVDGSTFYHIVTGERDALNDLFDALCSKLQERQNTMSESVQKYCSDSFNNAFNGWGT